MTKLVKATKPSDAADHSSYLLKFDRSALDKEFLLSGSLIPQTEAATSKGLAGKIVTFKKFHDSLDMYEATQGKVVTQTLPSQLLLASFPIVSETNVDLTVDFNAGMKRVFNSSWYSADSSIQYSASSHTSSFQIEHSRVTKVEHSSEHAIIHQLVQARNNLYEVRYFLTEYTASAFKPKRYESSRYVGFFKTHALLEEDSGEAIAQVVRQDLSRPVVFYISDNTPLTMREAVRDGVLYWNHVFGKEVLKVAVAPEGITAPHPEFNIIQWVPWDNAGSAYADVLADPRTGRALHSQIYLTSVFAVKTRERARALIRKFDAETEKEKREDTPTVLGFGGAHACDFSGHDFQKSFVNGFRMLLRDSGSTDADVMRVSQDVIRGIVAHEVGHVMGLRHNFAASAAIKSEPKVFKPWFRSYLKGESQPVPENHLPTSVMDYYNVKDSIALGYHLRTSKKPLSYDRAAIRYGYDNDQTVIDEKYLYCKDQDVGDFEDCKRFDSGGSPLQDADLATDDFIANQPRLFIEKFIDAKLKRLPLESVSFKIGSAVDDALEPVNAALRWFDQDARYIAVERLFPVIDDLSEQEVLAKRWGLVSSHLDHLPAMGSLAFRYVLDERFSVHALLQDVKLRLHAGTYENFSDGLDPETFSPDEKEFIVKKAAAYFDALVSETVEQLFKRVANAPFDLRKSVYGYYEQTPSFESFQEGMVAAVEKTTTSIEDDIAERTGTIEGQSMTVPTFSYSWDARMAAARAAKLASARRNNKAQESLEGIKDKVASNLEGVFGVKSLSDGKDLELSPSLQDWWNREYEVWEKFKTK